MISGGRADQTRSGVTRRRGGYDTAMTWRPAFAAILLAMALLTGVAAIPAPLSAAATMSRHPTDRPAVGPGDQSCTFTLSAPQPVVLPGGAKAVTSTAEPEACTGATQPDASTVCVSTPDGPGRCATTSGWIPAQVFVTASQFSGTFTATSKGCWRPTIKSALTCTPHDPISTTL
ncbi:MAG: hypothetical protein QOE41_1071 [Mycobacterium sp.]|jgi:hypothetical protein|nr:hypothetical protein [Mycobacterium sp.]